MVYWNRFISYIYRYHDGIKCENTGFAKVAKLGRTGKLTIGLKNPVYRNNINSRDECYGVYIYRETLSDTPYACVPSGGELMLPVPVYMGRLRLRCGRGEACYTFDWNNLCESERPITAYAGIAIRKEKPEGGAGAGYFSDDVYFSSWTDSLVDYNRMWEPVGSSDCTAMWGDEPYSYESGEKEDDVNTDAGPEPMEMPEGDRASDVTWNLEKDSEFHSDEDPEPGMDDVMACAGSVIQEALRQVQGETSSRRAIENMLSSYEKLPLLPGATLLPGADGVIESVKITPNDIGLLDMSNWKLGINSFLTHGFYNYKYLLLGKVIFSEEDEKTGYILGVPGVYSSREKYLAEIFGFERFVPEKEAHVKTGSFGYWIVDVR